MLSLNVLKSWRIKNEAFSFNKSIIEKELLNIDSNDIKIVKQIETKGYEDILPTNHDVKAVEYLVKKKVSKTSLKDFKELIHFALTSEDINNLSYGLMLRDSVNLIMLPTIENLYNQIADIAKKYKSLPILLRTLYQRLWDLLVGRVFLII